MPRGNRQRDGVVRDNIFKKGQTIMQKPTWSFSVVVFAAMLMIPGRVLADDSSPPCWRNGSNTTYQSWVFTVSNNPAAPETFTNPGGAASATFNIGTFGKGWLATSFGGKTGLWELGRAGLVSLSVPNFAASSSAAKYVQVQVTYFEDSLAYRPPTVSIAGATLVSLQTFNNLSAPPGIWKTQVTLWQIFPSPSGETIAVAGDPARGLLIDQIIVDTRVAAGGDGDVPAFRPCWRGRVGSTFQHWSFGISNNPASLPAELVTNSFGVPVASLSLGAFSSGYIPEVSSFFGCRQGIWDLGRLGTMTLNVPNDPSVTPGSYKYVQVEVTQLRDGIYLQNAAVTLSGGTLVNQQEQIVETNLFGEIWSVHKTLWRMGPPCPATEAVVLTGGTNGSLIDQVVIDTLCISLPCPADILAAADLGHCSKSNVTWSVPAVDGCVLTNVVCVPALGSTFPVGTNPVTCVSYDRHGGSRTCNFTVTIRDQEAPTILCPANLVVARDPAQCGAFVNFTPLAADNCSVAAVTSTPPSGSLFPLGFTTVTAVAHDASSNNSAPCNFTVQVIDFTGDLTTFKPCWRGRPGSTFQQWAFAVSNNPAAISPELATNAFGAPLASMALGAFSSGYLDQFAFLGCRQGIWDLGRLGIVTLQIPNAPGSPAGSYKYVQVAVTQYRDGIYLQNAAIGIAGGTLVSRQEQNIETNQIGGIWAVEKSVWRLGPPCPANETIVLTGGTNGTLLDQVVVDTLCLNFPCPTDIVANADLGLCSKSNVIWSVPVVDGCVVTNVTCVPPVGSTFPMGTNAVTCVVRDGFGGTNTCNFTVTVTDTQLPIALCKNIAVDLNVFGLAAISGADVDNGSTDNCGIASRNVVPSSFTCANIGSNGVTLTVTDVHGNMATCNATVTVRDLILPQFTCPTGITNFADPGLCTRSFVLPPLAATDNCGVASVSSNAPASFPVGVTPVTWTVVDVNSNTNSCVQLVTILDNQLPQIACPANVVTNATESCSQEVTWADPLATDNCTVTNVTCVPPSGSTFAVGVTTVNCTVWDSGGNTNGCSFTVTVMAKADLSVEITSSANPVTIGSNLVYTITVSNGGPCTATGVIVSNYLGAGQIGVFVTNGLSGVGTACPFPGPVAWWRAEGNANDSADGNSGTQAGGVTYVAGKAGQAFGFDGTNDSVTVPDAPGLRPASVTIEGWIKIQDVTGVHVVIGKRVGGATLDSYSMWIGSGVLYAAISDNIGTGPFLTYPEFPSSSGFIVSDIVNLQSFAYTLQPAVPADPLSQFIKTNLTAATMSLLAAYTGGPNAQLQAALVRDLNALIATGSIYDGPRFAGVTLSSQSQYVLGRNPQGEDLVRLNRYLIRDAYPADFAADVFPELNQQFHVAYSFDPVTQVQALYVNGGLVNASFVTNTIAYDAHPVLIGADDDNGSPGFFYQGNIDELTLYDRALTGTEIKAIYQADAAGKCQQPISLPLGNLASGAAAQIQVVAAPVACPTVSATATVTSGTMDPNLANNAATVAIPVQDLSPDDLRLTIERVNENLNLVLIGWPLTCSPFVLEATTDLAFPINWSPTLVPLQLINDRNCTVLPANDAMKYFRVKLP